MSSHKGNGGTEPFKYTACQGPERCHSPTLWRWLSSFPSHPELRVGRAGVAIDTLALKLLGLLRTHPYVGKSGGIWEWILRAQFIPSSPKEGLLLSDPPRGPRAWSPHTPSPPGGIPASCRKEGALSSGLPSAGEILPSVGCCVKIKTRLGLAQQPQQCWEGPCPGVAGAPMSATHPTSAGPGLGQGDSRG